MTHPPQPPLTLPEELLLLALGPVVGRPLIPLQYLRYGLAGAALADLEATGRITAGPGGRFAVTRPLPLNDPVLDGALAALPGPVKAGGGIRAHGWVRRAGQTVQDLCVGRLESWGAIRKDTRRALGVFPYADVHAGPVDLAGPVRERFGAALAADFTDSRARMLAALAAACDLDRALLPGRDHRAMRSRLRQLAGATWAAHAVQRTVQEDQAAVMSSTVASAVAVAAASS